MFRFPKGQPTRLSSQVGNISRVGLTEENHLAHKDTKGTLGDCGNSLAAVRANGCLFDPMSWAWQPPACFNKELVDDFLAAFDWHFYPNNATLAEEEFPKEKWLKGDYLMAWKPKREEDREIGLDDFVTELSYIGLTTGKARCTHRRRLRQNGVQVGLAAC
ncbi:hypothetical protein GE09DRAFT_1060407 [Coniochaeta sp. 2T2.1]|nr:hypothetical protein GE09DRAFT_1060407 [Coniochaeta sp. 2T2.1]